MNDEVKRPIGRPSKLTDEMLQKAIDYMVFDFSNVEDLVPSVAGLAIYLGVNKTTLYEFARVNSDLGRDFSNTLASVKEKQEKMLISGGLSGNMNATITKVMLSNHGYSEKQEIDHRTPDGMQLQVSEISDEDLESKLKAMGLGRSLGQLTSKIEQ